MYIVRFYKRTWGVQDLIPTPQSIDEYTDSYQQASNVAVFQLSSDQNNDEDDNNNNRSGRGGGTGNALKMKGNHSSNNNNNNSNARMTIDTFSSSFCHLIGFFIEQNNYYQQHRNNLKWITFLTEYRYGSRMSYCSNIISLLK